MKLSVNDFTGVDPRKNDLLAARKSSTWLKKNESDKFNGIHLHETARWWFRAVSRGRVNEYCDLLLLWSLLRQTKLLEEKDCVDENSISYFFEFKLRQDWEDTCIKFRLPTLKQNIQIIVLSVQRSSVNESY